MKTEANDVTELLIDWPEGDQDAPAQLSALVHEELRQLTHNYLHRDRAEDTSAAIAPVRESYLRMVNDMQATERERHLFYELASQEMRRVLVDYDREAAEDGSPASFVVFDGALKNFADAYPRQAKVVELKFFGGLETKEISELLQVSEKTVLRDWNFAKLWLCRALSDAA